MAIIAGFIISLMGGSKARLEDRLVRSSSLYGIIQQYGESGLIIRHTDGRRTAILLGVFKLGAVIKFIPIPSS